MIASVILSARNEYPSILYTVHAILEDLSNTLPMGEFEVILVDNLSDDRKERRGLGGTSDFLKARGMFHNGLLKTFYYPTASNVGARNFGVSKAKGKYIFFSDAHMFYAAGTFKRWIQTIDESGGIVHPAVAWIGSFPPQKGMQYSIKLGEEFKGTWNNYSVTTEDWFYVPAMGHCALGMLREQFIKFGGYIENKCYGGGELYCDAKWYMMGSCVVTEPRINAYHLSSERGYSYQHDNYIENVFAAAYALGADWWLERVYINYLRKNDKKKLDKFLEEAKKTTKIQREFSEKNAVYSFNDIIRLRPWDELNLKRHGKKNSGMLIYQDTILPMFNEVPQAKEAYENSKYQKQLAEFIDTHLNEYVYKKKK